jgi:methionyl-tRNA formyltransferase
MQMDAGLDTGPILLQRRLEIGAGDTGGSLHDALAHRGAEAILEALSGLTQGTLTPQPQPAQGATYAPKIQKSEARIDWSQDAASIDRQIRAFNPWPIAETTFAGQPLRIHAARPHPDARQSSSNVSSLDTKNGENGSIIAVQDDFVLVKCALGALAVTQLQQPGRTPVGARDFSHGRQLVGLRLG